MNLNNYQNFRNLITLSTFSCLVLLIFIYKFSKYEKIRILAPEEWWDSRFAYQEVMDMSVLGRSLFVYENSTQIKSLNGKRENFKILVWKFGNWAKRKYVNAYSGKAKDVFSNCSVRNCDYFYDDNKILEADAVLFYLHANWVNVKHVQEMEKLPRKTSQRWVYLSDESQHYTSLYPEYEGMFNWTMTFHTHSDVPTPLGRIVRRTDRAQQTQPQRDFHSAKPLLVAALQSFCGGVSGRIGYLDELVRHVKVDVFGKCGSRYNQSHSCPGWAQECVGMTKYKFYLVLENSLCSEYFSEKLWWGALGRFSVPVVFGGKSARDYAKLLPPQSYINVEDYDSPKDLANYLLYLGQNATEYNKYHQWRSEFQVLQEHGYYGTQASHYCRLCQALNSNSRDQKTVTSLEHFFGKKHCRPTIQGV